MPKLTDAQKSDLRTASENAPNPNASSGARKKGTKPSGGAQKTSSKTAAKSKTEAPAPTKKATKNAAASSAAALNAKANADLTAQPGIIASLMEILLANKKGKVMKTVDEIVSELSVLFPERRPEGMTTTVRAQLSRLPVQKAFEINKVRDGRVVRYAAA